MAEKKNNLLFRKIHNILFYGGISKDKYARIKDDVFNYNRKCILLYSIFIGCFFILLTIITSLSESVIAKNRDMYLTGSITYVLMFFLNKFFANKHHIILDISKYLALISIFAFGIVLAVNSYYDVTATYMVLLFAVPLVLMIRPFTIIAIILVSNIIYISFMYKLEPTELFLKNFINANIYATISIVSSTSMFMMKIQKYETDYMNRKLMMLDQLTGLLNRHAYNKLINNYSDKKMEDDLYYVSMDINGLKTVNDTYGHRAGDDLISSSTECMRKAFNKYGDIFRVGGDEFAAVLHASEEQLKEAINSFYSHIETHNQKENDNISVSLGYSNTLEAAQNSFEDLAHSADVKMYENKNSYYKKLGIRRR